MKELKKANYVKTLDACRCKAGRFISRQWTPRLLKWRTVFNPVSLLLALINPL